LALFLEEREWGRKEKGCDMRDAHMKDGREGGGRKGRQPVDRVNHQLNRRGQAFVVLIEVTHSIHAPLRNGIQLSFHPTREARVDKIRKMPLQELRDDEPQEGRHHTIALHSKIPERREGGRVSLSFHPARKTNHHIEGGEGGREEGKGEKKQKRTCAF